MESQATPITHNGESIEVDSAKLLEADTEIVDASTPAPLAQRSTADYYREQWQWIGRQIRMYLERLPEYIGRFFQENKRPAIVIGFIIAAFIALKLLLSILDALNDIPLVGPTLEIVGAGYLVWFVNRYLLKASTRQELSEKWRSLKQETLGTY
ncbi:MAG: CAAD domain-containing protein [Cyanosarcina radialis HA8281-LM2]|jgi:hypothetical protein|nr:CAAD domain-containing protein [Cyanosarcina radialis HA8281-LM2]